MTTIEEKRLVAKIDGLCVSMADMKVAIACCNPKKLEDTVGSLEVRLRSCETKIMYASGAFTVLGAGLALLSRALFFK